MASPLNNIISSGLNLRSKETALRLLLEKGFDVNQTDSLRKETPLIVACRKRPELVQVLLENGAQVDLRCQNNMTAFLHFVRRWLILPWIQYSNLPYFEKERKESQIFFLDTITLLLRHGADPTEKFPNGETLLQILAQNYHGENVITSLIYPMLCEFVTFGFTLTKTPYLSADQKDHLAYLSRNALLRQLLVPPLVSPLVSPNESEHA